MKLFLAQSMTILERCVFLCDVSHLRPGDGLGAKSEVHYVANMMIRPRRIQYRSFNASVLHSLLRKTVVRKPMYIGPWGPEVLVTRIRT